MEYVIITFSFLHNFLFFPWINNYLAFLFSWLSMYLTPYSVSVSPSIVSISSEEAHRAVYQFHVLGDIFPRAYWPPQLSTGCSIVTILSPFAIIPGGTLHLSPELYPLLPAFWWSIGCSNFLTVANVGAVLRLLWVKIFYLLLDVTISTSDSPSEGFSWYIH